MGWRHHLGEAMPAIPLHGGVCDGVYCLVDADGAALDGPLRFKLMRGDDPCARSFDMITMGANQRHRART